MRRPLSLAFDAELSSSIALAAAVVVQSFVVHGVSDPCNRQNLYGLLLELSKKFDEAQ
jgi:hypothetical protein